MVKINGAKTDLVKKNGRKRSGKNGQKNLPIRVLNFKRVENCMKIFILKSTLN